MTKKDIDTAVLLDAIQNLHAEMQGGFKRVDERLGNVEKRLTAVELDTQFIKREITHLNRSLDLQEEKIEDHNKVIDHLRKIPS